jgi:hypothetical protein
MPRRAPDGAVQALSVIRPTNPARHSTAATRKIKDAVLDDYVNRDKTIWQRDAYALGAAIGQVGKVHAITANTIAACDIVPVYIDPESGTELTLTDILEMDSEDEAYDATVAKMAEAVKRADDGFIGPVGGKRHLMWKAAWHIRTGGESFLTGTPTADPRVTGAGDSPELLWEFLSPLEFRQDTSKKWVRDSTGMTINAVPMSTTTGDPENPTFGVTVRGRPNEDGYVARFWQQDPAFSELPFCSMKLAIPDMLQYVELRDVIDAAIESRLSAGMLLVDSALSFGPPEEASDDTGEDDEIDPFTLELVKHMAAPIEDRKSGAALVPIVLRGAGELLKEVRLIDLSNDNRALEELRDTRVEVLDSILQIIEAPPELTKGRGNLNHWTGFAIDEEFVGRYVIPLGQAEASFLTQAYLQMVLEHFEDFDPEDAAKWVYRFDASNISAKADRGVTFIRLHDRDLVSDAATRGANGATEADAPSPEERRDRFILRLVEKSPAHLPLVLLTEMFEDIEPEKMREVIDMLPALEPGGDGVSGELPPGQSEDDDPSGDDPSSGDGRPGTRPGVDDQPSDGDDPRDIGGPGDARLLGLLLGEADATVERALERAGNKLCSHIDKSKELGAKDRIRNRSRTEILALIPETEIEKLGTNRAELLESERATFDQFSAKAAGLVRPFVERHVHQNGHVSADVARTIADEMTRNLIELTTLDLGTQTYDDGLRVPLALIREPLEKVGPVRY